jgi:hypothetical protein
LLAGLESQDPGAIERAMNAAQTARAEMNDGYVCDMSECFDKVETAVRAAGAGGATDAERTALRHAIVRALGHVAAHVEGTDFRMTDYGEGVRSVVAGTPPRLSIEVDCKVLCDRFGPRLVANLLRVMAGANRIAAALHFIKLNSRHVVEDSVAYQRNFHFAAIMTFAYLKEVSRALDDLSSAGIKGQLTDQGPWLKLQELRQHWERGARKTLRDDVAFHLGHSDATRVQVEKYVAAGERIALFQVDEDRSDLSIYHYCRSLTAREGAWA